MMTRAWVGAVLVCSGVIGGAVGCGSSETTCEQAISHALDVMAKDMKAEKEEMSADDKKEMRQKGLAKCKEDKWSAEVRGCIAKVAHADDLRACEKQDKEGGGARKAKATEAQTNLKKIYDGARSYYMDEAVTRGSITPVPKQFPIGDTGMTPPEGSCCNGPNHKCAPDPALWSSDLWNSLKFSMDDPHLYSYQYVGAGTEAAATFTVRAMGDLDCDGTFSTFELVGTVDKDGTVMGGAGMFKDKELE